MGCRMNDNIKLNGSVADLAKAFLNVIKDVVTPLNNQLGEPQSGHSCHQEENSGY